MLLLAQVLTSLAIAAASPSPTPTPATDPCVTLLSIASRPTFGTGVCTVRTGRVAIENSYTDLVTTGSGAGSTATYPQSLIRIGTADPHLDIEIGPIGENRSTASGAPAAGASDLAFGAKYELGYSSRADWGANVPVTVPDRRDRL